MRCVTVLGATGSIGASTLDVIARHPDRFAVYALTAQSKVQELIDLCARFGPEVAVIGDASKAAELREGLMQRGLATRALAGGAALIEVAAVPECDTVVAAIVGAAGLRPTIAAARAGKRLLLANKEAVVCAGALLMRAVKEGGAELLPLDSEHNAIFQCLASAGADARRDARLILTASGGPFRTRADTQHVTPDEACAHPNWVMGRKISVDSATLMNKGLEVIEASWLFDVPSARIEVVIHPQSVIHSMVAFADGSVMAQLGTPDMRTPIAYSLAWPDRIASGSKALDLTTMTGLSFEAPDHQRFPCLGFAYRALTEGGAVSAVLNAANEVAVEAFLARRIGFGAIANVIERVMDAYGPEAPTDIEAVEAIDLEARRRAAEHVQLYSKAA